MVNFQNVGRAAATAALLLAVLVAPAWGQGNCTPKGSDKEVGGVDSDLRIIDRAYSAKPEDFPGYREDLLTAYTHCTSVTEKYGKNVKVQQCIAGSAALLARLDHSTAMHQAADCAYLNVTRLTAVPAIKAAAWEGVALNREAWGQPPSSTLDPWAEAVKVPPQSQFRVSKYAKALASQQTDAGYKAADDQYVSLGLLRPEGRVYTPSEQEILKDWATLRRDKLRPLQDTKAIWAPLKTAESNFELARMAFAESKLDEAETYFRNAKDLARDQASASIATASNYHLAILRARNSDWTKARDYANLAVVGGQANKRLACLVYIAEGEKASLSQSSSSPLCPTTASGSAEDLLVYGAYLLRRAQFLNYAECETLKPASNRVACIERLNTQARAYRSEAARAFSDGRDARPDDTTQPPRFNWLLKTDSDIPALRTALRLGEDIARILNSPNTTRCADLTAFSNSLPPGPEKNLFATLDLLGCVATRTR